MILSKRPWAVIAGYIATAITYGFWIMGNFVDVYKSNFAGAVFEALWLPMLAMIFLLPVYSGILGFTQKGRPRLFSFILLFVNVASLAGIWLMADRH
jgi:hypothetical protein